MGKSIGQLTAAGSIAGTELIELQKLSATVTITAATLSAAAADNSYNDSGSGFVAAGFTVGMHVRVSGFTGNVVNNITDAVVTAVTAGKLTIGGTDGDVIVDDAAGESVTITAWESVRATADDLAAAATVDAADVTYTPIDATDWDTDTDPGNVDDALDQLANRLIVVEGASGTVADDSITNAKLAEVATATIKGRTTAGTGNPEDLTAAQAAAIIQGDGLTATLAGFRGIPQNSNSADYTLVAADAGKHILHPSGDANARTFTIPANASVAFPVGTTVTFVNQTSQVVSIAITTDTLTLANSTTTGTRSLAQNGVATAIKVASTSWIISGAGLT